MSNVRILKLRYVHVYCLFQNALSCILILQFQRLYKDYDIICFHNYVICSNKKKVKKIYFGLSGVCGIQTLNLDIPEMQLVLEKDHLTTELSGPINVKD